MRRFERGQRLLLVGSVLAIALFGDGFLTFAQQKAEPELMWEMRFEQGKLKVVRNEVARLKSEGKVETFPLKAMANQKEKKIVWFDEEGKVRKERTFEDAYRIVVSKNGKFFATEKPPAWEGPAKYRYFDEEGNMLWEKTQHSIIISPPGETAILYDSAELGYMGFLDRSGLVREFHHVAPDQIQFSSDGEYLVCRFWDEERKLSIAVFDKRGNLLLKKREDINRVAMSSKSSYIATSWNERDKQGKLAQRHLSLYDFQGNTLWDKPVPYAARTLSFSDDEKRLLIISLRTIDAMKGVSRGALTVIDVSSGKYKMDQLPFQEGNIFSPEVYIFNDGKILIGFLDRKSNQGGIHYVRLYSAKGKLIWGEASNYSYKERLPSVELLNDQFALVNKENQSSMLDLQRESK